MKARLRIIVAASAALLGAGAPSLAQAQQAPDQQTTPAVNGVIGPPQLRNFSLSGNVTQTAPTPAPSQQQPSARRQPAPTTAAPQPAAGARPSQPQPQRQAGSSPAPSKPKPPTRSADRGTQRPVEEPSATPLTNPVLNPSPDEQSAPSAPLATAAHTGVGGLPSMLPWLIAAAALAGALMWFFLRQRPRESFAGAGAVDRFEAPSAPPAAPVPAPQPSPAPQAPSGIVSTRLRPWLDMEFAPKRVIVDDNRVTVEFSLSVFNSGSAPARDVVLEAALVNAGPQQDEQIRAFFANPVGTGNKVPLIAPLQRISLDSAVYLQRDQLAAIEIEGRQLLVPFVAFNVLYSWRTYSGQSSVSYLIGKSTGGEKLAPLRLDLGSRIFRNLESREHDLRVRK